MMDQDTFTRQLTDEKGSPLTFRYTLLAHTQELGTQYGIAIESSRGERESLPGLSSNRKAVEDLLALAVQLSLSPTHLRDVAEDWLGQ